MNHNLFMPIVLQLTGVVVIVAEIIIPSGGILAIIAASLFGYSLYYVFGEVSVFTGCLFLSADVVAIPLLVFFGLKLLSKSPVTLRRKLSSSEGVVSQSVEMGKLVGSTGITATDLRPSGKAKIKGTKLDVVSQGEYIEKGSEVKVILVSGNQIIVDKK